MAEFWSGAREFFSNLALFGTIGFMLDALVRDDHKTVISDYVFSPKRVNFSQFERSVISALVGLLQNEDRRIDGARVFAYSIIGACSIVLFVLFLPDENLRAIYDLDKFSIANLIAYALLAFVCAYFSFPSDYLSVVVTKKIFVDRKNHPSVLIFLWVLDIVISILPVLLIVFIFVALIGMAQSEDRVFLVDIAYLTLAMIASLALSVLLSIFQISVILVGVAIRAVAKFSRVLYVVANLSNARTHPFTAIFLLAYVISTTLFMLSAWVIP